MIPLLNIYEPDDETLSKLGYVRYGDDSIIAFVKYKGGRICKSLYPRIENNWSVSMIEKEKLSRYKRPQQIPSFHSIYVIDKIGKVIVFDQESIGLTFSSLKINLAAGCRDTRSEENGRR